MDTFEDDNPKNLYVIRRKLAALRMPPGPIGNHCHYQYSVGDFEVWIYTRKTGIYQSQSNKDRQEMIENDSIVKHDKVNVSLYEWQGQDKVKVRYHVDLERDTRFSHYQPIKYAEWPGYSKGDDMPLPHLCELIKYLYRISNLTAFL